VHHQPHTVSQFVLEPKSHVALMFAEKGTFGIDVASDLPLTAGIAQVTANRFSSEGDFQINPSQRGPIDEPAWSRYRWVSTRWRQPVGQTSELLGTLRLSKDSRSEGTPYQQSGSRGVFASVAMAGSPRPGFVWTGLAYAHQRKSRNRWSWIDASRTAETPFFDQYTMPSTAVGALVGGAWWHAGDARTMAGVDTRFTRGELREFTHYRNGAFDTSKHAGGNQGTIGIYASHNRALSRNFRGTWRARLDSWHDGSGFQKATNRGTSAVVRDIRWTSRSGLEISTGGGIVWHAHETLDFRINGQNGFRRPSLEERFQDLGYHGVLIVSDPSLQREHIGNVEVGTDWTVNRRMTLAATLFSQWSFDAIGVRALPVNPIDPEIGVNGRNEYEIWMRTNFDRVRTNGAKVSAIWEVSTRFTLEGSFLRNDAVIQKMDSARGLAGKRPAQVARQTTTLSAVWKPRDAVTISTGFRMLGRQFIDTENTRSIKQAGVVDATVDLRMTKRLDVLVTAENIGGAQVESDKDMSGLVYLGLSRRWGVGVRLNW